MERVVAVTQISEARPEQSVGDAVQPEVANLPDEGDVIRQVVCNEIDVQDIFVPASRRCLTVASRVFCAKRQAPNDRPNCSTWSWVGASLRTTPKLRTRSPLLGHVAAPHI